MALWENDDTLHSMNYLGLSLSKESKVHAVEPSPPG